MNTTPMVEDLRGKGGVDYVRSPVSEHARRQLLLGSLIILIVTLVVVKAM